MERAEELLPDGDLKIFLSGNSKFIRSRLAILYLKAQEKEITDDVINVLTVGEIIHNSSLLHDDVIDDAVYRRGKTTIGNLYTPKISILCGDYLVSFGLVGYREGNFTVYHRLYDIFNIQVISSKDTVGYYDMDSEVQLVKNGKEI